MFVAKPRTTNVSERKEPIFCHFKGILVPKKLITVQLELHSTISGAIVVTDL